VPALSFECGVSVLSFSVFTTFSMTCYVESSFVVGLFIHDLVMTQDGRLIAVLSLVLHERKTLVGNA
jgi:hypothetical protein